MSTSGALYRTRPVFGPASITRVDRQLESMGVGLTICLPVWVVAEFSRQTTGSQYLGRLRCESGRAIVWQVLKSLKSLTTGAPREERRAYQFHPSDHSEDDDSG